MQICYWSSGSGEEDEKKYKIYDDNDNGQKQNEKVLNAYTGSHLLNRYILF